MSAQICGVHTLSCRQTSTYACDLFMRRQLIDFLECEDDGRLILAFVFKGDIALGDLQYIHSIVYFSFKMNRLTRIHI